MFLRTLKPCSEVSRWYWIKEKVLTASLDLLRIDFLVQSRAAQTNSRWLHSKEGRPASPLSINRILRTCSLVILNWRYSAKTVYKDTQHPVFNLVLIINQPSLHSAATSVQFYCTFLYPTYHFTLQTTILLRYPIPNSLLPTCNFSLPSSPFSPPSQSLSLLATRLLWSRPELLVLPSLSDLFAPLL